jgi:type VI protein secretion system component VasF
MSYHILHQFDEQWLLEVKQEASDRRASLENSLTGEHQPPLRAKLPARESQWWVVVALTILIATCSLFFAINASHRTEALQQRLDALETTGKK